MPGIRYREKVAREVLFLNALQKMEGGVIVRQGKEISMQVEVEGQMMYVNMTFTAKRTTRSGYGYNPHEKFLQVIQDEFEKKTFGKKGKTTVRTKTLTEYYSGDDNE